MQDDFFQCDNDIHELAKKYLTSNSVIHIDSYPASNDELHCFCVFKFPYSEHKVKVNFLQFNFNDRELKIMSILIVKEAYRLIDNSFNKSIEYCDESIDKDKEDEIIGLLQRKMMFMQYLPKQNLVYFLNDIFVDIITEHKLRNGNKRMGFAVLLTFLNYSGFYFKYTNIGNKPSLSKYNELNIEKIKQMLSEYETSNDPDRLEKLKEKTQKFIEENIIVSCFF